MHTELEIKSPDGRAYIEYYFNGERQREYNGKRLSLSLNPNRAKKQSDKIKILNRLKYEFQKALEKGWSPQASEAVITRKSERLETHIREALNNKLSGCYSRTYKRDVESLANKFLNFLTPLEKNGLASKLDTRRITEFLNTFNSSNRNYMNKRQTLNVLLPGTIQKTARKRYSEQLHEIYTKVQIKPVLDFLRIRYPKLHLVALLAYGCFLRPHEESRLLQRKNIRDQKIYLSGDENKGKKVRVVHIPDYVYNELILYIEDSKYTSYLFSGTDTPLNNDYFKTQWSRAKKKLLDLNLIQENQTLYSFRHTAAVDVYQRTKDVYLLQKLLGHSDITVTLKYLRGLGEFNMEELKNAAPQL